jgi:hypothetical protein
VALAGRREERARPGHARAGLGLRHADRLSARRRRRQRRPPDHGRDPRASTNLFLGATTSACLVALDADDSGDVNITDPILVLGYLFIGNATIPAPGPIECGADPSPDLDLRQLQRLPL